MSSSTSGRRRTTDRHYSAEDQALDQISKEAEERIQARRQARAEARAIRINEIERKQKEEEEKLNATQHGSSLDITKSSSLFSGSRRGSNDSTDTDASSKDGSKDPKDQVRELKNQLHELEDKYKAAMVTNAQLDNTKTSYMFQLELLKEQLEEQEETMIEVQREYKDKCRDFELLKRDFESTKLEVNSLKQIMDIKDKLLQESGLVIVSSEEGEFSLKKCTDMAEVSLTSSTALISAEAANLLKRAGEGTLGKHDNDERVTVLGEKQREGTVQTNSVTVLHDKSSLGTEGDICLDKIIESKLDNNHIEEQSEKDTKPDNTETENLPVSKTENNVLETKTDMKLGPVSAVTINVEIKVDDISSEGDDEEEVFFESKSEVSPVDSKAGMEVVDRASVMGELKVRYLRDSIVSRDSCISMESDVTYHRESEDELDRSDTDFSEKENLSTEVGEVFGDNVSGHVNKTVGVGDDGECGESGMNEKEKRDNVSFDTQGDVGLGKDKIDDEQCSINRSVVLGGAASSSDSVGLSKVDSVLDVEDNVGKNLLVENFESSMLVEEANEIEDKVSEKSKESKRIPVESQMLSGVHTLRDEFDEVFNSIPEDFSGFRPENPDLELKLFAKGYVNDIIGRAVDQVVAEVSEETLRFRQKSKSSEGIDIRCPKRLFSTELMDEVSPYIRQSVSRGSVEILSPLTHILDTDSLEEKLKMFSFKIDTDADVVLTSIEEENDPRVGKPPESLSSQVSGYGVYFVGDNSEVDEDSVEMLSPLSAEGPSYEPVLGQMPEIISMEINLDDGNDKMNSDTAAGERADGSSVEVGIANTDGEALVDTVVRNERVDEVDKEVPFVSQGDGGSTENVKIKMEEETDTVREVCLVSDESEEEKQPIKNVETFTDKKTYDKMGEVGNEKSMMDDNGAKGIELNEGFPTIVITQASLTESDVSEGLTVKESESSTSPSPECDLKIDQDSSENVSVDSSVIKEVSDPKGNQENETKDDKINDPAPKEGKAATEISGSETQDGESDLTNISEIGLYEEEEGDILSSNVGVEKEGVSEGSESTSIHGDEGEADKSRDLTDEKEKEIETNKGESVGDEEGASGGDNPESLGELSPSSKHAADKSKHLGRKSSKKDKGTRKSSKDEKSSKRDSKEDKGLKKNSKEECIVS